MKIGFANTNSNSSIHNKKQQKTTNNISFKGNAPTPFIDHGGELFEKLEFLNNLKEYVGTYFVRDGKEKNTIIVKSLDSKAFLRDTQSRIGHKGVADEINSLIEDEEKASGIIYSAGEEITETIKKDKDGKPMINKILDSILDKFEVFHPEKTNDLGMVDTGPRHLSENFEDPKNYILESKQTKFGTTHKVKLPDYFDEEKVAEVKEIIDDRQYANMEANLFEYLVSEKAAASDLFKTWDS